MLSRLPIRKKLVLGIALLMCTVGGLSVTSFIGVYAFRGLAKSMRLRAPELDRSSQLARDVSRLNLTHKMFVDSTVQPDHSFFSVDEILRQQFQMELDIVINSFHNYRKLLDDNRQLDDYNRIRVHADEEATIAQFQATLNSVVLRRDDLAIFEHHRMTEELAQLTELSEALPKYLHSQMANFANEVRGQYRAWIVLSWAMAIVSVVLLCALLRLFYVWIFRPLRVLVHGSRRVAAGDFQHRIQLDSEDEMAELANDMNNMTDRFREIRDDLDQQVQQRTQEVVRSEQLASVGFLAAGVAHEINNPLASIAFCAESLEERVADVVPEGAGEYGDEINVLKDYLKMIQDEAFRCKEITERLLDFSRLGDVEKQDTDLTDLVRTVIDMVKHIGKYKAKDIDFQPDETVYAPVNSQEMKQVVLNLLTNALDSLDPGGKVHVSLESRQGTAILAVRDEGCGMTDEVRKHLFEPFFTRRRDGQGTGLGMSITYRIVNDHGGTIQAESAGIGKGSTISVSLPTTISDFQGGMKDEQKIARQAA